MSPRRAPRHVREAKVICCVNCGTPLGFMDQGTLYLGSVFLTRKQPLPCTGCGFVTVWEPTVEQRHATSG